MVRRLAAPLVAACALASVPLGLAAYPTPFAAQGGTGVPSRDGTLRFVALPSGPNTVVSAIKTADGSTTRSPGIAGAFGIPVLTQSGLAGGLSHDGSALVLQSLVSNPNTQFVVLGTQDLAPRESISLDGDFGFDALSPDGSMLYLIQHTSAQDIQRYVVRAYDLRAQKLLPGRIADKTQKGWVMQGWAVSRVTTADGRWAYTLYADPGGYPFIHALDTVRGVAHCIGLPWTATDQDPVFNFTLALQGRSLVVRRQDGSTYRRVDTASWRVSKT